MIDKKIIKEIEKNYKNNQQAQRLGCLYDNRNNIICPNCYESEKGCKEMLEAYEYPPYENKRKQII